MGHAMGDCRVDSVFRHIAARAHIVIVASFFGQCPALLFHFICSLPSTDNHLTNAPHCLTVRSNDAEGPHIVQNILSRDGFTANTAFCKGDVFWNGFVEMMTDHQHVEMFFYCVDGKGSCGVGGGGQHIFLTANSDNIRRMPATGPFGMKSMDRPASHRGHGMFHKARFVQSIRVDHNLNIHGFCNGETGIDSRRCGAPIFVQFKRTSACHDLLFQCARQRSVTLASKCEVHRQAIGGL